MSTCIEILLPPPHYKWTQETLPKNVDYSLPVVNDAWQAVVSYSSHPDAYPMNKL